jgi:hypothetical protein
MHNFDIRRVLRESDLVIRVEPEVLDCHCPSNADSSSYFLNDYLLSADYTMCLD